jgi:hypothetical protein
MKAIPIRPSEIKQNSHIVFISDEYGISEAFIHIKKKLAGYVIPYLTLIYVVSRSNSRHLFHRELSILEKRYFEHLLVFYIAEEEEDIFFKQEFLEAIINSNISKELKFTIYGNSEFEAQITGYLRFLDIEPSFIESIKINNEIQS